MKMFRFFNRLLKDEGGNALAEFAVLVPIVSLLVLGASDIGAYVLLNQKLESAAHAVADLAARDDTLSVSQVDDIFTAAQNILLPFGDAPNWRAVVSGVSATVDDQPEVFWQRSGGGNLSATSQVGSVGTTATIPDELTVLTDETVIAAEVFYFYEPLFGLVVDQVTLRRIAFTRPRLGSLQTLDP